MIKNIISRFTMIKTTQLAMYDIVINKNIYYWQDCYFQKYMAASKWGYRLKLD